MTRILAVIAREVREAIPSFLFFLVVLGLGRLTKVLLLDEYQLTVTGTAVVVVGALILAKAVLVADALPITNAFARRALIQSVAWKSVVYYLITLVFHYLEEIIPLVHKYGGVAAAHERLIDEVSWPHIGVVQLWVAFAVVLYATGVELIRAIGAERARDLLFRARAGDS